jgi:hypothetical protein
LGGANNVSKVKKYSFLTEKGDAIVPPLLCMNQEYISALKSERGYPPVGSSGIWVCLLNKCEISNSYCGAMTRFGIRPCEKIQIIFNSDLKFVSVLSNVDK